MGETTREVPKGVPFIRLQGFNSASDRVKDFIHFTEGEADLVYAKINTVSNLLDWILYLLRQYIGLGLSKQEFDNLKKYVRMKLAHIGNQINGQTRNKFQAILDILERPDITSPEVLAQALHTPPFNIYSPRAEVPTTRPQFDGSTQLLLRNGASPPAVPHVEPKPLTIAAPVPTPMATRPVAPPSAPLPPPIIISPTTIPAFTKGVPIPPVTFTATGTGPYTWTTVNLPLGLQVINGVLSGTPTVIGTGTFTITATHPTGRFGSAIISYVIKKPFSFTEPMEFTAPVFVGGLLRSFSSSGGILPPFFINDVLVQVNGNAGFLKFVIKPDNFIFSTGQAELYKNNTVREGNDYVFYINRIGTKRTLVAARGTGPTWTLQVDKITTVKASENLSVAAKEAHLDREDGFQKENPIIKITFKGTNPPPPVMIDVKGVTSYTTSEGEIIQIPPGTAPTTVAEYVKAALLPGVRSPSSNEGQQGGKKRPLKKTRKIRR